ncbi:Putative AMP-dependent synthetase/ligase, Condensation domain, phosphopantetheine binding ACP [Septoria linicola]|uniref:AMP-dependent synthetase/ligase, Condensation domain, phosphopantetheine binding ACP n=1 Tax=Septoria linicola TaxID=215465 RepID=A0A9Q9AVT7_9PEZI|nr:putative AMP-dependent synthetase/ligase, Condensation domain, phosphopantetheine binding ACP [Septoria linicola]USW56374.1 Putative AMP-dependent synthetase/ligase, Condensation domain, phosphopantetheine binding ACP [Septoria linicola]
MSDMEDRLKNIWAEVLGRNAEDLSGDSNWFDNGGDSVLAIRLVNLAGQKGLRLSNQAIFDEPSLSAMANAVKERPKESSDESSLSQAAPALRLMQQWDTISTCLQQARLDNHELEDIAPCVGFQPELMRATNDQGIFTLQLVFAIGNKESLLRAREVIDKIVRDNSIFRTRLVQHEQDLYQVVSKNPPAWTEFEGSLDAYKAQDQARRMHYGDPLIRIAVVHDPQSTYIVWTKAHAVYDRWSRYELMYDIEAGFLDPSQFLQTGPRPPYRKFVDFALSQNVDDSMKFWENRLDGLEKFDLLFPESKERDYMSSKTDHERKRYVSFKPPQGRIGLDAINTVACALLLANESKLENIDKIIGPVWTLCPVRRRLEGDMTLQGLLADVSQEINGAIPHEPHGLAAAQQHFGHRRFYQFVTMMQPPKTPNFDANIITKNADGTELSLQLSETTQTRNFFGLYLMQMPVGDGKIEVWARYDDTFLSAERVDEIMEKYTNILEAFSNKDWDKVTVSELCPHIQSDGESDEHNIDESSTPTTLNGIFRNDSQSPALIVPGDESLVFSYRDLNRIVGEVQESLSKLGIKRGSAVSIALPNCMELIVVFLAATWQGAIAAPLNPSYKQDKFEFYIDDLGSAVLVLPHGSYADEGPAVQAARKYEAAIAECYWDSASKKAVFEVKEQGKMAGQDSKQSEMLSAKEDDVALVLHTSGTTGRPKAVPLTHSNLLASIRNICHTYSLGPGDRTMLIMPLFHVHGLLASFLSPLYSGGSAVVPQRLTPEFWDIFADHKATWYTATPSMHRVILSFPEADKNVIKRIRFIRSCSSQLSESLFKQMGDKFKGVPIVESYAMTEAGHLMTSNPLADGEQVSGSVGMAASGVELRILDQEKAEEMEQGKEGEVCIRGDNVTKGYLNNPGANSSSFTDNGFFRTGDQGKLDSKGYLFLTGRLKELINKGGEKICPVELDNVINKHEHVAEAVSFAIDDESYGQDVGCAVKVAEGSELEAEDLKKWISERIAAFKVPKKIWLTDEIPKTATGKVQRKLVAEAMNK